MRTRIIKGNEYVLCEWRRRYVRLTPEEYVRQNFLQQLVDRCGYPKEKIAVEVALENKRADAIIYDAKLHPVMLIEFKADTVALTQRTLDQAAVYNRQLHVPFLILHNGLQTVVARVADAQITFLDAIPLYAAL